MSGVSGLSGRGENTAAAVSLTRRQERAMLSFLYLKGYDDESCDGAVWDQGVRPWPTMDNLVAKGLIVKGSWNGPEEGYDYRLTDAGHAYMRSVVEAGSDV